MARHDLTDAQWNAIENAFPSSAGKRGRPWNDHRTTMNGIFWILRTGAPWRDLPERYGPWQSVYDRFARYVKDGTWDKIVQRLQLRLDTEGKIYWDFWCIDGSSVRASRAAAGAQKNEGRRARKSRIGTISGWMGEQAALAV